MGKEDLISDYIPIKFKKYYALAIGNLGYIYLSMGNYQLANKYFRDAINESLLYNNVYFLVRNYNNLAKLFDRTNQADSCIYYASTSLGLCLKHHFVDFAYEASQLLSKTYESAGKPDSTLKYFKDYAGRQRQCIQPG